MKSSDESVKVVKKQARNLIYSDTDSDMDLLKKKNSNKIDESPKKNNEKTRSRSTARTYSRSPSTG